MKSNESKFGQKHHGGLKEAPAPLIDKAGRLLAKPETELARVGPAPFGKPEIIKIS